MLFSKKNKVCDRIRVMKKEANMEEKKNEIILFENQGIRLEVNLKEETVLLLRLKWHYCLMLSNLP